MARAVLDLAGTDPVAAFAAIAEDPLAVLLDSAARGDPRARFSYIAANPVDALVVRHNGDPFPALARLLKRRQRPALRGLPPFQGGVAGWLSYDLGRHLERVPAPTPAAPGFPLMVLGVFDAVAAFDHAANQAWVIGEAGAARRLHRRLNEVPPLPALDWATGSPWAADLDRSAYEARIARVVEYIRAGDVFQANLAQRFTAPLDGLPPFTLYRRMRARAPGPFSAFITGGPCAIAAVSPERFLTLDAAGHVETRPIKGTRRRGRDAAEDAALAAELAASAKDRAENLMILDLMRNDLSRVCRMGSVRAPQRMAVETFPAIHHLVSAVTGTLRPGISAVDVLRACFPPGSITGAPKIRAMEIIAELETSPRGPYCGAYGWFGDDGAMDLAVAIRLAAMAEGVAVVHAGGGITSDSIPAEEYDETMVKAGPILAALSGGAP